MRLSLILKKNSRLHFAIFYMLFKCLLLFLDYYLPKKKKKVFGYLWKLEFIALNAADLFQEDWFDHFFSVGLPDSNVEP